MYIDKGDGESVGMLEDLRAMLSGYIAKSEAFQRETTSDIQSLEQDVFILNSMIEALGEKLDQEQVNEQVTHRLDNIVTLHKVLLHHMEKIDSQLNLLTGMSECASTHGWRRVGLLNMTNATEVCPPGWQVREMSGKRLCGRISVSPKICDSTFFSVNNVMYNKVCGRMIGYQFGGTTAFLSYHKQFLKSINDAYVDGVSITHSHPRKHIWTLAAGGTELDHSWPTTCPCDANFDITLPKFMDKDFFCESGINGVWEEQYDFYPHDPLWDGKGCTESSQCCSFGDPPYFVKKLSVPTSDDIEVRLCGYTAPTYGNVLIELLELYVQ